MRINWTPDQLAEVDRIARLDDRRAAMDALAENRGVQVDTIMERVRMARRKMGLQDPATRVLSGPEITRIRREYATPTMDLDRFAATLGMTRSTLDKCVATMERKPKRARVLGKSVPHPPPPRRNGHDDDWRNGQYAGRTYDSMAPSRFHPVRLGLTPQTSMVGCAADMCAR